MCFARTRKADSKHILSLFPSSCHKFKRQPRAAWASQPAANILIYVYIYLYIVGGQEHNTTVVVQHIRSQPKLPYFTKYTHVVVCLWLCVCLGRYYSVNNMHIHTASSCLFLFHQLDSSESSSSAAASGSFTGWLKWWHIMQVECKLHLAIKV